MRNKEINNGRIAMFSVLGIVSAEVYTSKMGLGQFAIAQSKLAVVPSSFCGASLAGGSCAGVACTAFDPSRELGAMEPMDFFDPAGFAKDKDEAGFKKMRSAEIRHGRAAMMGALGSAVQSVYKLPGFEDVPASFGAHWTEPGKSTLVAIVAFIGCPEAVILPWKEDPREAW